MQCILLNNFYHIILSLFHFLEFVLSKSHHLIYLICSSPICDCFSDLKSFSRKVILCSNSYSQFCFLFKSKSTLIGEKTPQQELEQYKVWTTHQKLERKHNLIIVKHMSNSSQANLRML